MRAVRAIADRDATLEAQARWPLFDEIVVGAFDDSFPLYRVLDGADLRRIAATGRVEGGRYAVAPERAFGASWGYDIDDLIRGGVRQRGQRLGPDLYVAKIDAFDRRFLHLSPGFAVDPRGPAEQPFEMDAGRCNWGLGCSVAVEAGDIDLELYSLGDDEQLRRLSDEDMPGHGSAAAEARAPRRLYHGTSTKRMAGILRHGISSPSHWGTEDVAAWFAFRAASEDGGAPVVVRVPLSAFDRRLLRPDERMAQNPVWWSDEDGMYVTTELADVYPDIAEAVDERRRRWRSIPSPTWQDGLAVAGAVVYVGGLGASHDMVVTRPAGKYQSPF